MADTIDQWIDEFSALSSQAVTHAFTEDHALSVDLGPIIRAAVVFGIKRGKEIESGLPVTTTPPPALSPDEIKALVDKAILRAVSIETKAVAYEDDAEVWRALASALSSHDLRLQEAMRDSERLDFALSKACVLELLLVDDSTVLYDRAAIDAARIPTQGSPKAAEEKR